MGVPAQNQFQKAASAIAPRYHPDIPVVFGDLFDENVVIPNVRMQRELLAFVPPPVSARSSAPQVGGVMRSAPKPQIGTKMDTLIDLSSVKTVDVFGSVLVGTANRVGTGAALRNILGGQGVPQTTTINEAAIFNWLVTINASRYPEGHEYTGKSFDVWAKLTHPRDKYVQLAAWAVLNSVNPDARAVAVHAAAVLGVPDLASFVRGGDPLLCKIIINSKTRIVLGGVIKILEGVIKRFGSQGGTGVRTADDIDKFFAQNALSRSYKDRMLTFRSMEPYRKGIAILEWLAGNATGNVSDSPGAPVIRTEASRLLELYNEQYKIDLASRDVVEGPAVDTDVTFINDAYNHVRTSIQGTYGFIDQNMSALVQKSALAIEGTLLPAKRGFMEMHRQLAIKTGDQRHAEVAAKAHAEVEAYEDALRKYHEIFSANATKIASQLKALYVKAKDMEMSGADRAGYAKLVTSDIPELEKRLQIAMSGSNKGFKVVLRRITAKNAIEIYPRRLAELDRFATAHSDAMWAANPMYCPFSKAARAMLSKIADMNIRISKFKNVVHFLQTALIPKIRATDEVFAQRIDQACATASSFEFYGLVSLLKEFARQGTPNAREAEDVIRDLEKFAIRGSDVLEISREMYDARYGMGYIPFGKDPSRFNYHTPMSEYADKYISVFLFGLPAPAPAPAPAQVQVQVPDVDFFGQMGGDPLIGVMNFMPAPDVAPLDEDPPVEDVAMELARISGEPLIGTMNFASASELASMDENPLVKDVAMKLSRVSGPSSSSTLGSVPQETGADLGISDAELNLLGIVESCSDVIEGFLLENRARYSVVLDANNCGPSPMDAGSCPPIDATAPTPLEHMIHLLSFVPRYSLPLEVIAQIGTNLALNPTTPDAVRKAYAVTVVPVFNMLREFRRVVPDYTSDVRISAAGVHSVRGLSSIIKYTAPGALHSTPFPSFPFSEIDAFRIRFHNVTKQFPMRIGTELKIPPNICTGYSGIIPDSGLKPDEFFVPVWFNTPHETGWKFGHEVPIGTAVTPFWSPMPDVMNARPSKYLVPDGFIMPNTMSIKSAVKVTGSRAISGLEVNTNTSVWNQFSYANRVFLIPGGKISPGAHAYRVGRFVSKCNFLNDMFYSWQAEMGSFEIVSDKSRPKVPGVLMFVPRQHVCLVFSHSGSMARMQFNNRAQASTDGQSLINGPHMQNFCGVVLVRCCVPADCPTGGFENGPWYCGVFGTFDGTLKSFLEGPDMEFHDISGNMEENLRGSMLRYSFSGIVPCDMRFKAINNFTPQEYWSRMVTYVHVMREILEDIGMVLRTNAHVMIGVCPENFVYDTNGLSLANAANSLYLKAPVDLDRVAAYSRVTGYDVAMARRFLRRNYYNFKILGIGSSCNFNYSSLPAAAKDVGSRCLPLDIANVRANYPLWHASDPFLPHNLVSMSPVPTGTQLADNRISITCDQAIILARYVFFKMCLCDPESYMHAASIQASLWDATANLLPGSGPAFPILASYAYKTHDMGLIFAQEPGISKVPMFVIPKFIKSMLVDFHHTQVSSDLEKALFEISSLLGSKTEFNLLGTSSATLSIPGTQTPLNVKMYDRMMKLGEHIARVVDILNSRVPPQSESVSDQIDTTPLK
jgi:hypothetical protein